MQARTRLLTSLLLLAFSATALVLVAQEAPPTPAEGTEAAAPDDGAEAAVPDEGAEAAAPDEGAEAAAPDEGTETPASAQGAQAPAPEQRADTPAAPREESAAGEEEWEMPALPDDLLEDDVFIPSEEIQADEEVTFPVNI